MFVNKISMKKTIYRVLLFLAFIQLCFILYCNLFELKSHLGWDASWLSLKITLILKEKALICSNWVEQTNPFFDSSIMLAVPIYALLGDVFIAYGIANNIVFVMIMACFIGILKRLKIDSFGQAIACNLLMCPYLTQGLNISNEIGYFACLLATPAYYNVRMLCILLLFRELIIIIQEKRIRIVWWCVCAIMCFISGTSSGLYIFIMMLFPCCIYVLVRVIKNNDLNCIKTLSFLFIIVNSVFLFVGKITSKVLFGVEAVDTTRRWISVEEIWTNIGAVFQGFMRLLNVLPPYLESNVVIISKKGVITVFSILIFGVVGIAIFSIIRVIHRKTLFDDLIEMMLTIVCVNFSVFSLYKVGYGNHIFEERYLISTYIFIIIMVGVYFSNMDMNLVFSKMVTFVLLVGVFGADMVSDYYYLISTNDSWNMDIIKETAEENSTDLVYFWGREKNGAGKAMRVYDLDHIYKQISEEGKFVHHGDYLDYEKNSEYAGPTLLVVIKDDDCVPKEIMNHYSIEKDIGWAYIYKCDYNPISIDE